MAEPRAEKQEDIKWLEVLIALCVSMGAIYGALWYFMR